MLFSRTFFAAFLAVAAVGVSGSPVESEKRDSKFVFCQGKYWQPPCAYPDSVELEKCHDFITEYNLVNINTFVVPHGLTCGVFV